MSNEQDNLNCIKNLMQLMCCDKVVAEPEKKFLVRAAMEIGIEIPDWNALLKEVIKDEAPFYPIEDQQRAQATLQSLVVMAKADKHVDDREKEYIQHFAKSIGVSPKEWKKLITRIDIATLFDPFKQTENTAGGITILKEHFDKIDDFTEVANEKSINTTIIGFDDFIAGAGGPEDIVCFHAAPDTDESVKKCRQVMSRSGDKTVSILTRFQGHQVKYMLEQGLKRCIIEPVYTNDIDKLFANK